MPKARILVVDDEPTMLVSTAHVLTTTGYDVVVASSGAESIRLAEEVHPELVLLDVSLPDIDGFEVCRRLKANPALDGMAVIMLSGLRIDADSRSAGLELGADGYITRPVTNRELLAHVEALLRIRAAEAALRRQRQQLYDIVAGNADGMLAIDEQGCVLYANAAACALLDRTSDDLVGAPIGLPFAVGDRSDIELALPDGTRRTVEMRVRKMLWEGESAWLATLRDVSDRRLSERLLQARMALVDYSASHSVVEILQYALDEVGRFVSSPVGFYHLVAEDGHTLAERAWSTQTLERFCTVGKSEVHCSVDQAGVWADCVQLRRPVIHNDLTSHPHLKGMPPGHAAIVRELTLPIYREGRLVAVMGIGNKPSDYTEDDVQIVAYLADIAWELAARRRAEAALQNYSLTLEDEVRARTNELLEAQTKLVRQERLAVLGQLAGSVGHELRNPLGVITNSVYVLRLLLPDVPEQVKEYLDLIESEAYAATRIIGDLLEFPRVTSTLPAPVAVTELIQRSVERYPLRDEVTLVQDVPSDLGSIYVDAKQIVQVLGNLLTNAQQAIPGTGQVTILVRKHDDHVSIAISDTGSGMSTETLARIFDPLFTTKARGIGLGLPVCEKLVTINGGSIEVRSEVGVGSTFTVLLPTGPSEVREMEDQ